jgi:hypothetical protein
MLWYYQGANQMKMWPFIIGMVVILAIIGSPALAISKSDLISSYKGQSSPTPNPTPTPTPIYETTVFDDTPIRYGPPPRPTPFEEAIEHHGGRYAEQGHLDCSFFAWLCLW